MNLIKKLIGTALAESYVPDEIRDERLYERCRFGKENPCPFLNGDKCKVCGCYVELKAQMDYNKNPKKHFGVEKTHCPKGMWPFIDSEGRRHDNDLEIMNFYNLN